MLATVLAHLMNAGPLGHQSPCAGVDKHLTKHVEALNPSSTEPCLRRKDESLLDLITPSKPRISLPQPNGLGFRGLGFRV